MASLRPFHSSTLEGAFLEAAFLMEKGEIGLNHANKPDDIAEPWSKQALINITMDTNSQRIVVTATIPIKVEPNSFSGYLLAHEFLNDYHVYAA